MPVLEHLDARILAAIARGADDQCGGLKMEHWHACDSVHCRAGWAIHLAGAARYALEEKVGPAAAGGMIYRASTGRWPDFYATNAAALADIRKHAEADPLPVESGHL